MITESILGSTKKSLGIEEDDRAFDSDIIDLINGAFFVLEQAGVGPKGFTISDEYTEWTDYIPNIEQFMAVKNYIYLHVQTIFDPPASSYVLEAKRKHMDELLWRLNLCEDLKIPFTKEDDDD